MRELRNVVQRAYVMATGSAISDEWLELQAGRDTAAGEASILSVRVGTTLADAERSLIFATLEHFEGHKERTAAALGVSLKTLYNRFKEYGAEGAPPSSPPARERRAA